jgi:hypothetical protein
MPSPSPRRPPSLATAVPFIAPALVTLSSVALAIVAWARLGQHFLRSPLARDPAQFQFVAWAVSRGAVDYRDLHDMNGPLSHAIHWFFMHLGGLDDGRFRRLELFAFVATAGLAGHWLPRLSSSRFIRATASFALVAGFLSEYLRTHPWNLSQRDAMALWFVLPATSLTATALGDDATPVRRRRALLVAGALVGAAATIKPFFGLMGAPLLAGALAVLPQGARVRAGAHLLLGGVLGTLPALVYTMVLGSVADYLREGFVHGPLVYFGIDDRALSDIVRTAHAPYPWLRLAAVSTVVGLALMRIDWLPRRNLPVVLAPAFAVATMLVQHKGTAYHVYLAVGVTLLLWVQVLVTAVERCPPRVLPALSVGAVGAGLALWSAKLLSTSALLWPSSLEYERLADGDLAALPNGPALGTIDYFPRELRLAGDWLRSNTEADARVYVYGHDAAVLLYGRRRPAVATLANVAIDLGGMLLSPTREALRPARVRALEELRRRYVAGDLARLQRDGAAACVLIDRSPSMTEATALGDLRRHAPEIARWVEANFRETVAFGPVHLWSPRSSSP